MKLYQYWCKKYHLTVSFRYNWLELDDIKAINVPELLTQSGLFCLWVPNNKRIFDYISAAITNHWGFANLLLFSDADFKIRIDDNWRLVLAKGYFAFASSSTSICWNLRFANLVSLFVNFSHIIKNPTNGLSLPVTKNMRVIFLVFLHPILW